MSAFYCPACKTVLNTPRQPAAATVTCPTCKRQLNVPAAKPRPLTAVVDVLPVRALPEAHPVGRRLTRWQGFRLKALAVGICSSVFLCCIGGIGLIAYLNSGHAQSEFNPTSAIDTLHWLAEQTEPITMAERERNDIRQKEAYERLRVQLNRARNKRITWRLKVSRVGQTSLSFETPIKAEALNYTCLLSIFPDADPADPANRRPPGARFFSNSRFFDALGFYNNGAPYTYKDDADRKLASRLSKGETVVLKGMLKEIDFQGGTKYSQEYWFAAILSETRIEAP